MYRLRTGLFEETFTPMHNLHQRARRGSTASDEAESHAMQRNQTHSHAKSLRGQWPQRWALHWEHTFSLRIFVVTVLILSISTSPSKAKMTCCGYLRDEAL